MNRVLTQIVRYKENFDWQRASERMAAASRETEALPGGETSAAIGQTESLRLICEGVREVQITRGTVGLSEMGGARLGRFR